MVFDPKMEVLRTFVQLATSLKSASLISLSVPRVIVLQIEERGMFVEIKLHRAERWSAQLAGAGSLRTLWHRRQFLVYILFAF